jgi:hypothetical protein
MTDLDALRALHDAVKTGELRTQHLTALPEIGIDVLSVIHAFHGDLNDATLLIDTLFPGCHWSVSQDDDHGFCGKLYFNGWHHEHGPNPARALLLALIAGAEARAEKGE